MPSLWTHAGRLRTDGTPIDAIEFGAAEMTQPVVDLVNLLIFRGILQPKQIEEAREAGADPVVVLAARGVLSPDLVDGLRSVYAHLPWRYTDPKRLEHALLRAGVVEPKDLAHARRIVEEVRRRLPEETPSEAQVLLHLGCITHDALTRILAETEVPIATVESKPVHAAIPVESTQGSRPTTRRLEDGKPVPSGPPTPPGRDFKLMLDFEVNSGGDSPS